MRRMLTQSLIVSLLCLVASRGADAGPIGLEDVESDAWSGRTLKDTGAFSDLRAAQYAVHKNFGYNRFEDLGSNSAGHLDSVFVDSASFRFAPVDLKGSFRARGYAWGQLKHVERDSRAPVSVPEPASITLLGIGFLFAAFLYRRMSTFG